MSTPRNEPAPDGVEGIDRDAVNSDDAPRLAVVVKGYPRLSETFIAQELAGLERRGVRFDIWSLRHPTDRETHPIHDQIQAKARYLPEYLRHEPLRVLRGLASHILKRGFWRAAAIWFRDLRRDRTINRLRRFGQAAVLARELPAETHFLYSHFLHTPTSTARYAAIMRDLPWGFAAHAKDIWTIPLWEKREKIADCAFGVTCTDVGARHLQGLAPAQSEKESPDRVSLLYHGLDLSRFPPPPEIRPKRDGAGAPIRLISVGRLVAKKGYDDLIDALALLPADLSWRLVHIGGGELKSVLKAQADKLGVGDRIEWRGAQAQTAVIEALRASDLFVLPSRIAPNGDRDGLPNVLMEAASQKLAVISTTVSAIPEFVVSPAHGRLISPQDPAGLSQAIADLARDPARRAAMADTLYRRLTTEFSSDAGLDRLAAKITPFLSRGHSDEVSASHRAARPGAAQTPENGAGDGSAASR